ncbi:hypothetical protein XA68_11846 [Ophiocordyceps unilateralis]|uniref:NWD NACHT-NTPase N-terminal domain-containing protein n=1 Tax=Ophiocordyceps unilateralis TaxID=268505 RepID=A0A2A9PER3_OPHUN|nr:hypothetical protein XA68_11846 [Ophiocordyceps unilateralis]
MSTVAAEQFQHQAPPPEPYQGRRSSVIGKFVDRFRSGSGGLKATNSRGGLLPDDYYENKDSGGGDAPAGEDHVPPPAAARNRKRGSITMSASALSAKMRGGRKEVATVDPTPAESAPSDLWTESYNALRDDETSSSLTLAYESIVSKQLPKLLKQDRRDKPLRGCSDEERADLMLAVTRGSMSNKQGEQSEDDEAQAMLASCREAIAGLMSAQPNYAAAWAGFCSLTPELLQTVIERNDLRAGLVHIIGRVSWYGQLEQVLDSNSWTDEGVFREQQGSIRANLSHLYRAVLELEMNCVCATAGVSDPDMDSVVAWDELNVMVRRIMQADDEAVFVVRQHCTAEVQDKLLPLVTDFRMPSEEDDEARD